MKTTKISCDSTPVERKPVPAPCRECGFPQRISVAHVGAGEPYMEYCEQCGHVEWLRRAS